MYKKPRILPAIIVLLILFGMLSCYTLAIYIFSEPASDTIVEGVYIENVNVGDMTVGEASTAVESYVNELSEHTLHVDVNGSNVDTTLAGLDYRAIENDVIDKALAVGREGNLFTNYNRRKAVAKEHVTIPLSYTYSEKKLKKFVKKKCGQKCRSAKNSVIKMKNGKLTYTKSRQGVKIDTDATIQAIQKAVKDQGAGDITVPAVVTIEEPQVPTKLAKRCKDKLGTYTTSFNAGSISRSKNVANAARLINKSVIMPGETFSVHDAITPMTEKNGYYAAPSYNNGQVVDSIGGGVCQVSTTLYNAVLRAELEVIERSPHSMVVTYVKPSMDAAIAGDYKDFKFRNNTEVPIYIQGGTYSGNIYFNIYGEETRDPGREVTFESEVLKTIEPGQDQIVYDSTKPSSYVEVTQSAHTGYEAVLWKIVKQGGKTKKKQVNQSSYKAVPRYVTKGTGTSPSQEQSKPDTKAKPTPKPTKEPTKSSDKKKPKGEDDDE